MESGLRVPLQTVGACGQYPSERNTRIESVSRSIQRLEELNFPEQAKGLPPGRTDPRQLTGL